MWYNYNAMAYKNVEDRKAYHREWYAKNRQRRVGQITAYQQREAQKVIDYKLSLGCSVCGYNRCAKALDFHHLEDETKEQNVGSLLNLKGSFKRVWAEITKCKVLCCRCHRELHAGIIAIDGPA